MHNYSELKLKHGNRVSQTIDAPIMVMDFWEISDAFLALMIILVFGVVLYSWSLMLLLLAITLGILPVIKKKYPKGILLHWPYRRWGISLPGLFNPRSGKTGQKTYSD